ncbi:TetR family transcriptional regulator [Sphaerisporangium krabiense]|uniref:AcrR family transcriptional regulator n=1 Tax=Sphaerisporangium krabiense TaxID=763782 RepID=A0A7W8Z982_9ACTN|nr:TetR/AcrR family transcriptional regulator [Sphaerisporangium krabiense]MBB5629834.1 AcrR family transcriptional regulator [Sphaerisporangium krabiense]GII63934.1 TetR family transcriptional regulator [Sphaerisporangium krabiense]
MSPRKAAALREGGGEVSLRDHLIATAVRLIATRGTAGLTVRAIAREARVADGVLYNHFADKEELLALALHAHVRAAEAELGEPAWRAGEGTVEGNLRAYIRYGLALHIAILPAFAGLGNQPKVLARFQKLPNPVAGGLGLRAGLAAYLGEEQRLGRVASGASPDAAATMIVGACHELILPRLLFGGTALTADQVPAGFTDDLVTVALTGIGPRTTGGA